MEKNEFLDFFFFFLNYNKACIGGYFQSILALLVREKVIKHAPNLYIYMEYCRKRHQNDV